MRRWMVLIAGIAVILSLSLAGTACADFARKRSDSSERDARSSRKSRKKGKLPELASLKGPKKTIAVMDFENKAGVASQWNLGNGMAEMLTTALFDTGRFIVVERKAVQDVLAEQDFGASGRTTQTGAAKIGKILNAQVLIRGAVTEFTAKSQGADNLVSFAGIGVGLSSSSAHVGLHVRLYDSTTGEVIDSIRCDGKASAGGFSGSYSGMVSFGTRGFIKTPLGKATQKVINQAVAKIARKMDSIPWEGKIVTVKKDVIYMNAGQNANVDPGEEFTVYKKGEELIDPDTGISLGSEDTKVGRIQVTSVEEKFSKAVATAGSAGSFKRGDIVRVN